MKVDKNTTCADVKNRAEGKIADIEEKIHALQKMKKTLTRLAKECRGRGPASECPILEALEK